VRQIDLEPHEYQEVRPEPVFGPGWPFGCATVLAILTVAYVGSPIAGPIAGLFVFAITMPILTALVSDRQLQVRQPPHDLR
jgi:hypothetical protein